MVIILMYIKMCTEIIIFLFMPFCALPDKFHERCLCHLCIKEWGYKILYNISLQLKKKNFLAFICSSALFHSLALKI